MWGMGVMLAPVMGPTLGGYLTEMLSWHWILLINVLLGAICITGLILLLPDTPKQPEKSFNGLGFAYLAIALGSLQLVLDRGLTLDWFESPEIVIETMVCGVCLFLFLTDTLTSKNPYVDPKIFLDANYVSGLAAATMLTAVLILTMVLWPLMLQNIMGYPVITTGILMVPRGLGAIFAMWAGGRLARFNRPRLLILMGILLSSYSLWESSHITLDADAVWLSWVSLLQGAGVGMVFVPMSLVCYETLDRRHLNQATVIYAMTRNVGASVGVSVVITAISTYTVVNHAVLTESINSFNSNVIAYAINSGNAIGLALPGALAMVEGEISRQAAMAAYGNIFLIMSMVTLTLAILLIPFRRRSPPEVVQGSPSMAQM